MLAFISYSSSDRALARRIAEMLRRRDITVWIDEGELGPGDPLPASLTSAIEQIDLFVIILTKHSVSSKWVEYELDNALPRMVEGKVRIVALRCDDSEVPKPLSKYIWGDGRTEEGLVHALNLALRDFGSPFPLDAKSIRERYKNRIPVRDGIRLVPSQEFRKDGRLGLEEREYVFIGDYEEQRGRSLGQILASLWIGDAYDQVSSANLEWTAVIFVIGETNPRKLDLKPATWKAIFRILAKRLKMIIPCREEEDKLGPRPRDYYEGDQEYWRSRIIHRIKKKQFSSDVLKTQFGYDDDCFDLTGGIGITDKSDRPSRLYLVKNAAVKSLNYRVKELGHVNDGVVLY